MQTVYAATTNTSDVATNTASELTGLLEMIFTKIPLWIAALIVVVLAIIVAKIARRIVENKLAEKGIEEEHQEIQILGGRIAYSGTLILGLTVALKIAGIDLTTIIAAVAFGIGFALKDLIMNFLAGIMILISRHFVIGDFIKVGGTLGKVIDIQSRVTVLQAIDGTKVVVPNADLFSKQVTSYTSNPFRRIELIVGVDYRHNLENVVKVCMNAIKNTKKILIQPKPCILISEFSNSSINLKVRAWVESRAGWLKIKSNLAKNIKKDFDKYGIVIPWPITTLVYDKDSPIQEKKFIELEKAPKKEGSLSEGDASLPANAISQNSTLTPVPQTIEEEEQPLKPLGEK